MRLASRGARHFNHELRVHAAPSAVTSVAPLLLAIQDESARRTSTPGVQRLFTAQPLQLTRLHAEAEHRRN